MQRAKRLLLASAAASAPSPRDQAVQCRKESPLGSAAAVAPNAGNQAAADSGRLAYTIAEAVRASGIGRTKLYELIREGRLEARKAGGRTLIPADALRALLDGLPPVRPVSHAGDLTEALRGRDADGALSGGRSCR